MRVRLLVDHAIATDADNFVAQWNSDAATVELGIAVLEDSAPILHAPIWDSVAIALLNVGAGITINALTEVLKPLIKKMHKHGRSSRSIEKMPLPSAEELNIEATEVIGPDGIQEFRFRLIQKR